MHPKAALLALHGFEARARGEAYYIQCERRDYIRLAMFAGYTFGWFLVRDTANPPRVVTWDTIPDAALDLMSDEFIEMITC